MFHCWAWPPCYLSPISGSSTKRKNFWSLLLNAYNTTSKVFHRYAFPQCSLSHISVLPESRILWYNLSKVDSVPSNNPNLVPHSIAIPSNASTYYHLTWLLRCLFPISDSIHMPNRDILVLPIKWDSSTTKSSLSIFHVASPGLSSVLSFPNSLVHMPKKNYLVPPIKHRHCHIQNLPQAFFEFQHWAWSLCCLSSISGLSAKRGWFPPPVKCRPWHLQSLCEAASSVHCHNDHPAVSHPTQVCLPRGESFGFLYQTQTVPPQSFLPGCFDISPPE